MTDETGRIEAAATGAGVWERRKMGDGHYSSLQRTSDEIATSVLAAADAWDAEHGVRRIDTRDEAWVEKIARAAFWSDDLGGHHRPGSRPHVWENIPEVGRENYRELARAVLAALRGEG